MNGTIPYISDIAADILKPLFIVGCSITAVGFFLCLFRERWLRHSGRLVFASFIRFSHTDQLGAALAHPRTRLWIASRPSSLHRGCWTRTSFNIRHETPRLSTSAVPAHIHDRCCIQRTVHHSGSKTRAFISFHTLFMHSVSLDQ